MYWNTLIEVATQKKNSPYTYLLVFRFMDIKTPKLSLHLRMIVYLGVWHRTPFYNYLKVLTGEKWYC